MKKLHRSIMKAAFALFITISLFILSSCPQSLTRVMLQEVKDEVPPVITVTSPLSGDAYGAYTLLTGSVTDLSNDGASGKITSLTVTTPGKDQIIPVNDDGSFTITLETNGPGYDGDIIVVLTAVDWNGNVEKELLGLKKAAGDIVGFVVSAGNKSAEISWEALPGAASYSIQEFRSGTSAAGITDTSYTWTGLANGNKCSFRVSAMVETDTYFSSVKEVIPLSETTLAPLTESVYRGINLQWQEIPAAVKSEYVIERAENKNGPYTIRTITPDSFFSDDNLERNASYFYRVYPVEKVDNPDIAVSSANYGSAGYYHGQNDLSVFANYDTPNSAFEVAIKNNRAYVADGTDGLVIIDISDPSNPSLVGSCETKEYATDEGVDTSGWGDHTDWGNAGGIALTDNGYACIANREGGLVVIDIDPARPGTYLTVVARNRDETNQPNESYGVVASGNYVYFTIKGKGVRIIDISGFDPSISSYPLPVIGSYSSTSSPRKIVLQGNYAYLASSSSGLEVIDISNPGNLTLAGYYNTGGNAMDVWVSGDYAYVADGDHGLRIINISSPSSLNEVGHCTLNDAKGVTISGNRAYVANGINGLAVIDISTPASVTDTSLLGVCDTPGDAQSPLIDGDYAYVTDYNSGLEIIDVSSPASDLSVDINAGVSTSHAQSVALSGNYLSVADGSGGYKIIDISDPSNLETAGSWHLSDSDVKGVDVSGNYAYAVDFLKGLHVIDISDPSSVSDNSSVVTCNLKAATPGRSYGIAVYGSYAYVAEGPNGLQIVDISDPLNPKLAGLSDTDGVTVGVAVSGHYAYLADKSGGASGGFKIIDISDPDHPVQISSVDADGDVNGVAVAGNLAYAACNELYIFDISDPVHPENIGSFTLGGSASSVTISGSLAFVAMKNNGMKIIDISNPVTEPDDLSYVSSISSGISNLLNIAVSGNHIYGADDSGGIIVINY